ncbi:MAG: hypothetical protein NTZ55_01000 [Candidatus Roizmanbacteria bacterium]|nr:hypothetical protein [Candidatus Roizmanbacteria bacterium]
MIHILLFVIIAIFIVIIIFSFPQFSPVPYFPSNSKDMWRILEALAIRNDQTIIDLGAGDGIVIFQAAKESYSKKLNTRFIAVEINPILLLVLHIRRLFHPNRTNIRIVNRDMFVMDYSKLTSTDLGKFQPVLTFYIYVSPWFIEKTVLNIVKQIKIFDLVSYFYQVKCLPKHKEKIEVGVHSIFTYS